MTASATAIYTLSLHDALPISALARGARSARRGAAIPGVRGGAPARRGQHPAQEADRRDGGPARPGAPRDRDRKSTRLNSSHTVSSYAVFCLKKKKTQRIKEDI